jgi:uncharacterized protein (DUF488 family)
MILYTLGHSTGAIEGLLECLRENEISVLVDVRSKPRSRLFQFDQYPLQTAVESEGMRYRFLGDRLGGVPRDPAIAARWKQGKLDDIIVAHLRSTDAWNDGLAELTKLMTAAGGTTVCIMCSEGDANECHRKAVALDVAALLPDVEIRHLSISKSAASEIGVQEVLL